MVWEDRQRIAVCCNHCKAAHVAVERDDGELVILGTAQHCSECGRNEFHRVEQSLPDEDPVAGGSSSSSE